MKYDKYIASEVVLNCEEQGMLDFMIQAYVERVMHKSILFAKSMEEKQ